MSASPPPSPSDRARVLASFLRAAEAAAKIVMRVYREPDFGVEHKGPNDPVTRADREANVLLLEMLGKDFPGVPLVAEESDPSTFAGYHGTPAAIFIDPVDGTRDFIAKTGEFAVMLGFAEEGRATVGVVACPVLEKTYAGIVGEGAFVVDANGVRAPITVGDVTDFARARCAVSRFHRSKIVEARLALLGLKELVPVGSAGIKAIRVATGDLEIYAHPSGGAVKLWDACGPDAVVRAAGGILTDARGVAFDYRGALAQGEGTVAANTTLHAEAVRRFATVTPIGDGKPSGDPR